MPENVPLGKCLKTFNHAFLMAPNAKKKIIISAFSKQFIQDAGRVIVEGCEFKGGEFQLQRVSNYQQAQRLTYRATRSPHVTICIES